MSGVPRFRLFREVILSSVTFGNVCILGLLSHIIRLSVANDYIGFTYAAPILVMSLITMTIPALAYIQSVKRTAITIKTEVCWLGCLTLAWTATVPFSLSSAVRLCNYYDSKGLHSVCAESGGIFGFETLMILALAGYVIALLVIGSRSQKHGSPVWGSSFPTAKFEPGVGYVRLGEAA